MITTRICKVMARRSAAQLRARHATHAVLEHVARQFKPARVRDNRGFSPSIDLRAVAALCSAYRLYLFNIQLALF
ncbi:hypothetical protein OESDEN_01129 [Oesophagostomum dentatum]|uniref:Uncharacterized protein n=1 Tax=Oesophagostomum dentatum TaxID=61180 RepID=A0A0B1TTW8_OESDE|nr:hypothetical protein OESDEN_01129 [Oesophagostomum dentatum]